jgi:hypothetical protein
MKKNSIQIEGLEQEIKKLLKFCLSDEWEEEVDLNELNFEIFSKSKIKSA